MRFGACAGSTIRNSLVSSIVIVIVMHILGFVLRTIAFMLFLLLLSFFILLVVVARLTGTLGRPRLPRDAVP